jgi:nucleotide-binding universal stress UspA family protein
MFFKKVIVGDDGLDGGADALALARAVAPGAELVVACAYPWDATPSRFMQLGYGNIMREDTEKALRHRVDGLDPAHVRTLAIADTSPARALHRLAEAEQADLIVTGTARHARAGRMFLGDVSRDVLHGSPCPVAVAPQGFSGGAPVTIGVAYDHTPEADKALSVAIELAGATDARLEVREVVAADLLPAIAGYPLGNIQDITNDIITDAQERLDATIGALNTDVPVTARAVIGTTVECLGDLAKETDMVVCGSRAWGAIRRVVLGSTADRLIHSSSAPVLVVPRSAHTDTAATTAATAGAAA